MEQRGNYASAKDVQTKSSVEECALGTGQRSSTYNAAAKDVQTMLKREECALDMGQRGSFAAV